MNKKEYMLIYIGQWNNELEIKNVFVFHRIIWSNTVQQRYNMDDII